MPVGEIKFVLSDSASAWQSPLSSCTNRKDDLKNIEANGL